MKQVGVGLLGFGTVGAGVVDALARNGRLIAERTGIALDLRAVADLDWEHDRGVALAPSLATRDAEAVVRDPRNAVLVETIGGTGDARRLVRETLRLGKPVVTANKALLAEHGGELFEAARRGRTGLFFEASVGGGIPILRAMQEGLVANEFERIAGILNGTCNYILTRMTEEGMAFDAALAEAQRKGYAETDPGLDIDGHDSAHKACILASLAFGHPVRPDQVSVRGIRGLDLLDIVCAAEFGYCIKMLAAIHRHRDQAEVSVQPSLVPAGHVLAGVSGAFNAILVDGDVAGRTLYYGKGAGRYPTASAILGDLTDAAGRVVSGGPWNNAGFVPGAGRVRLRDADAARARQYLRLTLRDRPGILARVAQALGTHGISLSSVLQREQETDKLVPVIMITHEAPGRAVSAALREIDAMDCVGAPAVRFRIESDEEPRAVPAGSGRRSGGRSAR